MILMKHGVKYTGYVCGSV